MQLPYAEPLIPRGLADPGGDPCTVCPGDDGPHTIWSNDDWILNHGVQTSLAGAVWLTTRVHVDSFADLNPALAKDFGVLSGRIDRALLALPQVARNHMYRWGDGGAHFHVWFLPRPLGMLQAQKMMLPLWEEILPEASAEAIAEASRHIAMSLTAEGPLRSAANESDLSSDRA